jgi:hypothetical protein
MDGVMDCRPAGEQIADMIRAANAGLCSGEPAGVRYPGVPSVEDVLAQLGIEADDPLTEDQWIAACEIVDPD